MEFGCKDLRNFIEKIYDFLDENDICFLSGSFVFDDQNDKLFTSFVKGHRVSRNCGGLTSRMFSKTHDVFMKQKEFANARAGSGMEYQISRNTQTIQRNRDITPPLTFLCDKKCRLDPRPEDCNPHNEEAKGIAMFYPFEVQRVGDFTEKPIKYMFMKLEGHTTSLAHPLEASAHVAQYFKRAGGHVKKMTHPKRREDDAKVAGYGQQDLENMITYFVREGATDEQIARVEAKIMFYNQNIRTANEMYIPSELLDIILYKKPTPAQKFKSAGKAVMAMSKLRQEAAGVSNESLRRHARLAMIHGRQLFPLGNCMEASYYDSRDMKYKTYTKDQLLEMARVMNAPVSSDMTKQEICDIISAIRPQRHLIH